MELSNSQRTIYEMDRAGEQGTANIAGDVFFKYPVTEEEIKAAVESLVKNCGILRVRISETGNGPMQEIQPYTVPIIRTAEFDDEETYREWAENQASEPVDIYGCLYFFVVVKVHGKCGLFFRFHHIVADAWSMGLCCGYINNYLRKKTETEILSYFEHVEEEQKYFGGKRHEKDKAYWLDVYSENSEPSYFSEKAVKAKTARRFHSELSAEDSGSIACYSRKNDTSEYAVFMSALAVCYSRRTGTDEFYIGTPVLNRDRNRDFHTVGTYINTVPLSITIDGDSTFNRVAGGIKKQVMQAFRHEKYSYTELLSEIRTKGGSTDGLYDVMLSYQNTRMPEGTEVHWYCCGSQNESLQIHIDDRNNEGRYHIDYDYQTEKFSESDIARFHGHLINVLLGGIASPEKRISELPIMSPDEYDKVVYGFNDTSVDYPNDKTIDRLFVEQVRRTPDKTAVIACDRTLTYAQLDEESNRVANGLIAKGVKPGDMVALMLPRTSQLIVSIFGILKSGGVYLPIDPGFSSERKEYILRDSKTKYVISDNDEQFSPKDITLVKFSELHESTNTYPSVNFDSGSACYCIYTSGSTGEPKGTVITHRCLNNFCNNNNNNYHARMLNVGNNVIATIQICFDVSVFEIFLSLLNGLKVVLADEGAMNSGDKIGKLITKYDIDIIHATPTKIQMYMSSRIFCDSLKRIKIMMIGAEIFTDNLLKTLRQYTRAIIYNGYGPSETTIGVTFGEVDHPETVDSLFDEQARRTPDKTAVIACDRTLTYSQLDEESNRVANGLIAKGVKPGDIVAFKLPRKSFILSAMFGILKAGAAYLPIDPAYPDDRIEYMLADSKAKNCIDESNIIELTQFFDASLPESSATPQSICYCIYTSGSTGKPKGTLLKHGSVANYCYNSCNNTVVSRIIKEKYSSIVSTTTVSFDIFVTESILPMLNGMTVILADETQSSVQRELNKLLVKYPVDVMQTTPTKMAALCADEKQTEYLKSLKALIIGGEAFDTELCARLKHLTDADIFNIYGPTETTVWVTNAKVENSDITIGKPIANTQIYILDKYLHPVPIGVEGELCIAGDCVGAGYLNRPELTAEKFISDPFGPGKMYRSGDIAKWREDGNIEYIGRNDFQVKIRGLRIELGEIENAISSIDGITQAVVIVRKDSTGRQLICAFYTGRSTDPADIRSAIIRRLPRYMLPHIFTHLDSMPMTPSGKVNRRALPEVDLENIGSGCEYVSPRNETERKLCELVAGTLKADKVGIDDDFFDLGGDSLVAITLTNRIGSAFGVRVDLKTIFEHPVIKELAAFIDSNRGKMESIPVLGLDAYELTPQQLALVAACEKDPETLEYNMPMKLTLPAGTDVGKVRTALGRLYENHRIFRARLVRSEDGLKAMVDNDARLVIEETDDTAAFVRPFDLYEAPLIRVALKGGTLLVDTHHLICDGTTVSVLFKELGELYEGKEVPAESFWYGDYSAYLNSKLDNGGFAEAQKYFGAVLTDDIEPLKLPESRSAEKTGKSVKHTIESELFGKCLSAARKFGVTQTAYFLGMYGLLMAGYSAEDEILTGIAMTNRTHPETAETAGMFVNTLPAVLRTGPDRHVSEYLAEVNETVLSLSAYQEYPSGKAAETADFDLTKINNMFVYQAGGNKGVSIGGRELFPEAIGTNAAKFGLTFELTPEDGGCIIRTEYRTDICNDELALKLTEAYIGILSQTAGKDMLLSEVNVLLPEEYNEVVYSFNDTAVDYPKEKTIDRLFMEQVRRTPDKTAVIACDRTLTYAQLDEESNRVANGLIAKDVKPGDIVAFKLPRRSFILSAMFGILKAGAAYLPIDPELPTDRIEYMLTDSKARYCIDESNINELISFENSCETDVSVSPESKYCIIYTSGSTGTPKGCILLHKGIVNFCVNSNVIKYFKTAEIEPRGISVNNVVFDYFIAENVVLLLHGNTTILCSEEESRTPEMFWDLCKKNGVNLMQTTPTKYRMLFDGKTEHSQSKKIRLLVTSGERCTEELIDLLHSYTNAEIFNPLGPSETSIWVPNGEKIVDHDITIGKPIANTQIYILDKYLHPVPIGVEGELCIAGDCVGAGYLNRPELTAEKFIVNPFGQGKMYRSGDLAKWREDGNIEYIGRNDFQVKIRGLRIELGEIENAISSVDGITQAVVIVRKDSTGRQLICAFYTGQSTDPADIRSAIIRRLPRYMLPHIFTHLDSMPMTPSGKVNRRALPEVDLENIGSGCEYVSPRNETERKLCELVAATLKAAKVGIDGDFFDLGGDSLKAIELVSKAHADGIFFSLQNVFDCPTVRQLYTQLESSDRQHNTYSPDDFVKINELIAVNANDCEPEPSDMGDLLLTGATGFLGIHILASYLDTQPGTAYCLVRGKDEKECSNRLKKLLQYYFDGRYLEYLDTRIIVLCGDTVKENLGLADIPSVKTVINAAASVKHFGSYKYFYDVNVLGTVNVMCAAEKVGARFIQISTLSVSGNSMGDNFDGYRSEEAKGFSETDLYIGQELDNVYIRSKFEAEKAVLEEVLNNGVKAKIIRVGNLTNRYSDLRFQPNYESNAFLKRFRAFTALGAFPEYMLPLYCEFSPVDETAAAVIKIASHSSERNIFHVYSDKPVYFDRLLEYFKEDGIPMEVLSVEAFADKLKAAEADDSTKYIPEALVNDMDKDGRLVYDSNIHILSDNSVSYLKKLGFEWNIIDNRYVSEYIKYLENRIAN